MNLSRREIVGGLGLISSMAAAGGVSACSPPPPITGTEQPGAFFSNVARRHLENAKNDLKTRARLTYVMADRQEMFEGPGNIVGELSNLMHSQGFNMIGDNRDYALGGLFWQQMGPWQCSDMIKGSAVDFEYEPCGHNDRLRQTVLNVFVSVDSAENKIQNIMLLENLNLVGQWGEALFLEPPPEG